MAYLKKGRDLIQNVCSGNPLHEYAAIVIKIIKAVGIRVTTENGTHAFIDNLRKKLILGCGRVTIPLELKPYFIILIRMLLSLIFLVTVIL
jgi:hypothetical protein